MKLKKGLITSCLLFITAGLLYTACDNTTAPSFEDSIDLVVGLEPITGTENSVIKINKGTDLGVDSWFVFDIDGMQTGGIVNNGVVEGWCVEWNKPIQSDGTAHLNYQSYSTFGKDKWKPLNYFLSIKDQIKAEDPSLTYKEIQATIWSLIAEPKFDLNKLTNEQLPTRLKKSDGTPDFSKEKVLALANRVMKNVDSFEYKRNKPVAVLHDMGNDKQVVITFRTQTQGGWGAPAAGNNPGAYRDANFSSAFPGGLVVGGIFTITLENASDVEAFLPSGGAPQALAANHLNPTGNLGTLAGNVVALTLSVVFDEFDPDFSSSDCLLKDLIIQSGTFTGWTVQEVLDEANKVLGGTPGSFSASELNEILDAINNTFVDGSSFEDQDLLAKP